MAVKKLIEAAFQVSALKYSDLHKDWITVSMRIGGKLPNSILMASVQRAGQLDVLLRSMEDEFSIKDESKPDFSFQYQMLFSELWIGQVYEICRLLKDRKCEPSDPDFNDLSHGLRLLRVTMDKHEIANERKLSAPLMMQKQPPNNDASDFYEYSKDDPTRGHIMPTGVSERGSSMWQVIDVVSNQSYWLERRNISERFLKLFTNANANKNLGIL